MDRIIGLPDPIIYYLKKLGRLSRSLDKFFSISRRDFSYALGSERVFFSHKCTTITIQQKCHKMWVDIVNSFEAENIFNFERETLKAFFPQGQNVKDQRVII